MSTDDRTPDIREVRSMYCAGSNLYRETPEQHYLGAPAPDYGAEFDRFLDQVRRDAAREALDGFKAWRGTRQCPAISPPDPCNRPEGHTEPHAYTIPEGECDWREFDWSDTDTYRDRYYPEETHGR